MIFEVQFMLAGEARTNGLAVEQTYLYTCQDNGIPRKGATTEMVMLLDTHQHLLYRNQLQYAWTHTLPELAGQEFTVQHYQDLTVNKDVAATLFMEVDADDYQRETRFVSKLAGDPENRIVGIIASCRPEEDAGFDAWLEECAGLPVVGFRRILHEAPDDVSHSVTFRSNLKKIGAMNKVFDLVYRADQLDVAYECVAACDGIRFVLDHCGVPDIAGGEIEQWKAKVARLATLPHLNAKLSGVLAYCAPGQSNREAIKPYVDHVIECFGSDRLVWGSDWPVVNRGSDLPSWIDIFRSLISDLSPGEKEAVCNGNAQRIYGVAINA